MVPLFFFATNLSKESSLKFKNISVKVIATFAISKFYAYIVRNSWNCNCNLWFFVHEKMKYSALSVAIFIPCLFVVLLTLSNNISPASPRFYVMAAPIFVSITAVVPRKYIKISLPILIVLMAVGSAFFTFASNVA